MVMRKRHLIQGRWKRIVRWTTLIKYGLLTLAGIWLYRCGAEYAFQQRGYFAVGGEVFALLLPFFYWTISCVVREMIRDIGRR